VNDLSKFLNSIEGHGYGGMAEYEIARSDAADLRARLEASQENAKEAWSVAEGFREQLASARKALEDLASEAERYAEMYPVSSDGRNTFLIFAGKIKYGALPLTDEEGT
jgi:multidrug resistance efflux pump